MNPTDQNRSRLLAIVADIHGNIDRLEWFCGEIRGIPAGNVYVLGDILQLGRSSEDNLCVDLVSRMGFHAVFGNHEYFATLRALTGGANAPKAQGDWDLDAELFDENIAYIDKLPKQVNLGPFRFAHSIPDEHTKVKTLENAKQAFGHLAGAPEVKACFIGHYHQPVCFSLDVATGECAEENRPTFQMDPGRKYIVNPGALGVNDISRYLLFDPETLEVQRKEFRG